MAFYNSGHQLKREIVWNSVEANLRLCRRILGWKKMFISNFDDSETTTAALIYVERRRRRRRQKRRRRRLHVGFTSGVLFTKFSLDFGDGNVVSVGKSVLPSTLLSPKHVGRDFCFNTRRPFTLFRARRPKISQTSVSWISFAVVKSYFKR